LSRTTAVLPAAVAAAGLLFSPAVAEDVRVSDVAALRQAVRAAKPGTRILLAPGTYQGGMGFADLSGEPGKPLVIASADPNNPARIAGGGSGLHLSRVAHLELRDLHLTGASGNGLNIDDGGNPQTPTSHLVLRNLRVTDVGPGGNRDGIKLSGVYDFRVEGCTVERWGAGGSGIDMVGCHRGVIERCVFRLDRGPAGAQGNGVQAKGGSTAITIRRNRFEEAGGRAVNIGGSTGIPYFRPRPQGFEAKDIRVEGNVFVGSAAPVCFVGVDGALVRFNTLYRPGRWAIRILQETRDPDFVPSRNGVFEDNIVVFRSGSWASGGVNIGPGTAPETFRFARNLWFCEDEPARSRPTLPTPEAGAVIGQDPGLRNPSGGDFTPAPGSPAAGKGATALR
jgi:hypothetical protein